jgi:hypothetical protein
MIRPAAGSIASHFRNAHGLECTRMPSSSSGRRRAATSFVAALSALSLSAGVASRAYADGDPASDVLAVQKLFLPTDAHVPIREQLQLSALLNQSSRNGYPLRVAIIGSQSDLGSVTALWGKPQTYARFLGGELGLVYHGTVLVIMPNGYGADVTAAGTRTASGEAQLPVPGQHLGDAAITAVERFAASAGTPLAPPNMQSRVVPHSASALPWLAFALGLIPLALAWGLSLRRQPLALHARQR